MVCIYILRFDFPLFRFYSFIISVRNPYVLSSLSIFSLPILIQDSQPPFLFRPLIICNLFTSYLTYSPILPQIVEFLIFRIRNFLTPQQNIDKMPVIRPLVVLFEKLVVFRKYPF